MDYLSDKTRELADSLQKKFEAAFIEGLRRKGFSFINQNEIESFVSARCHSVSSPDLPFTEYLVDKTPFMRRYKTEIRMGTGSVGNPIVTAEEKIEYL